MNRGFVFPRALACAAAFLFWVDSAFYIRASPPRFLSQNQAESLADLRTVVDWTPEQLTKAIPELKHLEAAENQGPLPQILERVGAGVAAFFRDLQNTTCTEEVSSEELGSFNASRRPGAEYAYDDKFNYLVLADATPGKTRLKEYRTDSKGKLTEPRGAIVTKGFASMSAHFHPDYQPDSRFRYLGREVVERRDAYVVAFAQRPEVARMRGEVTYGSTSVRVLTQGVAWIDPESFLILRLRTDLLTPQLNIGLRRETTEIKYSEVSFSQGGSKLWLPREVIVTGKWLDYDFRNRHRYSGYRLFSVETEEKHRSPAEEKPR